MMTASNIALLEHINLRVPDRTLADTFYLDALGCTLDPRSNESPTRMWLDLGRQQFHVPVGEAAEVLRGITHLRVDDLDQLEARLAATSGALDGTSFTHQRLADRITVRGPWGNRFECRQSSAGSLPGIAALEFVVRPGAAAGIGRFYAEVIGATVTPGPERCVVGVRGGQELRFVETDHPIPDYDGHHIAIYLEDFAGPLERLAARDLVVEEASANEFRFNWIVDPDSGEPLFEVEHEVRSTNHPMYDERRS